MKILDTTLRDGEQTPGVSLTTESKLLIAKKIDSLGVDIIEAGSAHHFRGERASIKKIANEGLNARYAPTAALRKRIFDAALGCDVDSIHPRSTGLRPAHQGKTEKRPRILFGRWRSK